MKKVKGSRQLKLHYLSSPVTCLVKNSNLSNFSEKIEQILAAFAEICSKFLEMLDQLVAEAN